MLIIFRNFFSTWTPSYFCATIKWSRGWPNFNLPIFAYLV